MLNFISYNFKLALLFDSEILLPTNIVAMKREMQVTMIPNCRYMINIGKYPNVCPTSKGKMSFPIELKNTQQNQTYTHMKILLLNTGGAGDINRFQNGGQRPKLSLNCTTIQIPHH